MTYQVTESRGRDGSILSSDCFYLCKSWSLDGLLEKLDLSEKGLSVSISESLSNENLNCSRWIANIHSGNGTTVTVDTNRGRGYWNTIMNRWETKPTHQKGAKRK